MLTVEKVTFEQLNKSYTISREWCVYRQHLNRSPLIFPAPYGLIGYGNSSFTRDLEYIKSVIRYYLFLNSAMVFCSSKKEITVSTSTTKIEYIAISYMAGERVWIKGFINKLTLKRTRLSLKGDNKTSFNLTKNPKSQYQTKHIDIQYHYIFKLVNNK